MNAGEIVLSSELFFNVFPFHVVFDSQMRIIQAGKVIERICGIKKENKIINYFKIKNLHIPFTFAAISKNTNTVFLLKSTTSELLLKGGMHYDEKHHCIVFLCTPVINNHTMLKSYGLSLSDFPVHDPIIDYIFVYQSLYSALTDAKLLAKKMSDGSRLKQIHDQLTLSQQQLSDLYEHSPDMLLSTNVSNHTIIKCNFTFLDILGYQEKDIIGKSIFNFCRTENQDEVMQFYKDLIEIGYLRDKALQVIKSNGESIDVSLSATVIRDKNNSVIYCQLSLRDITARKLAETEIKILAQTDSLTQLANRDYFNKILQAQLSVSER